jgi:hypothetical protein
MNYLAVIIFVLSVSAVLSKKFKTDVILQHFLFLCALGSLCWLIGGSVNGILIAIAMFGVSLAWWLGIKLLARGKQHGVKTHTYSEDTYVYRRHANDRR